jgi:hypothetical protein
MLLRTVFLFAALLPASAATVFTTGFEGGLPAQVSGEATLADASLYYPGSLGMGSQYVENLSGTAWGQTVISLGGLALHTSASLEFLFLPKSSWDGLSMWCCTPDYLYITVDGLDMARISIRHYDLAAPDLHAAEPLAGAALSVTNAYGGAFIGGAPISLSAWNVALTGIPHSAASMTIVLQAGGGGWQSYPDEWWGADNITVSTDAISGVPEPGTMVLLPAGLLALAWLRRRHIRS